MYLLLVSACTHHVLATCNFCLRACLRSTMPATVLELKIYPKKLQSRHIHISLKHRDGNTLWQFQHIDSVVTLSCSAEDDWFLISDMFFQRCVPKSTCYSNTQYIYGSNCKVTHGLHDWLKVEIGVVFCANHGIF